MAKKLETLKLKRRQQFSGIDRIKGFIDQIYDKQISEAEFFEIQERLSKLSSIYEQFEATQSDIEILTEFDESEEEFRQNFENKYFSLHVKLREKINKFKTNSSSEQKASQVLSTPVQLPLMNLPTFNGEYHRWHEFRDTFLTLVGHNKSLTNIQKFYHLRSCLHKNVLETIQAIPVTNDNYDLAFKQLKDRYERDHLIASNHVNNILNFPKLIKESSVELRKLYNCLHNNLEALKNLNIAVEHWDLILIPIVSSKLDTGTIREWEKFSVSKGEFKFQEFLSVLSNRAEFLERMESNKNSPKPNFEKKTSFPINKVSTALHVQGPAYQCPVCKGNHPVFRCNSFLELSPNERKQKIVEKHLCINCLKPSHSVKDCSSSKCRKCGKSHNTLLHFESPQKSNAPKNSEAGESTTVATTQIHSRENAKFATPQSDVILPTALILVADKNNEWHHCRALLDSGAMSNFISRDFYQKLKLPAETINCSVRGVGSSIQKVQQQVKVTLSSCQGKKVHFRTTCLILDKITSNIPLISFNKEKLKIPSKIKLADPTFDKSSSIDILLGSSMFWELLGNGRIKIPQTRLTLQKTKLGWILGGLTSSSKVRPQINHSVNLIATNQISLEDQIRKFWEIEEVGVTKIVSQDDKHCEESFSQTHSRDKDGRFIVKVPFKDNVKQLGLSRHLAIRRFKFLEQKLIKNPDFYSEYIKIMNEYITLGHMKEIHEDNDNETASYYIPHHAVSRSESLTTKIRVVFDASMPTSSGLSLNDVQYIGPTIQNDLFSILTNFRLHRYVISSDISKMYRMVWLHEDHKPFHRIFWRENPSNPLKCYELQTVTFGTASAPYLAIRCLHQLAAENAQQFPKTSKIIKTNFYVDDLIYGSESLDDLVQVQHEITTILAKAGFLLRKWLCNESKIYSQLKLNPDLECNTLQFGDKEHKTLGISWDINTDKILYSKYQFSSTTINKRTILSQLSKIFDPLGLLGPILVVGKLLMQRLWQEQISWDEPIPLELASHWLNFQNELNNIQLLKIDRRVLIDNYENFDIHGFCDASQGAYGACIFIRSTDKQGSIASKLLCSKSRVAPIKTISLPRLELNAAVLLAQLVNKVLEKIETKPKNIYYWTDSTITLAWIQGNPSKWKTYVSNRVGEIQQLTEIRNWHHVSSSDNPADILSRGTTVNKLINSEIWWLGPYWLTNKEISFESNFQNLNEIPEEKILVHFNTEHSCDLINRYSNFEKLLRVTAYCCRFKENCKSTPNQRKLGDLSVEELKSAKNILIRVMQREAFPKDYHFLQLSKPLQKQSRLLSLNPFLDNDNLIRVGGRLQKTHMSFDAKHPVILAPGHVLTKLITKQIHENNFHCGPSSLLSFVRQKYWPINGRNLVRGIVRGCRICFLSKPKSCQYLMGQLPACRATKNFPFENVGIDYAGPILIKDRKTRNPKYIKAYICLFVCMATKAIHLECVTDLSTEAFILCLKRFVSRRGKPSNIYSDNAKNFVSANAEIKRLFLYIKQNFHDINKFLTNQEIVWHFIPARSPSFGGIWEAGIKSAKSHLNKITKNMKFDYEQFSTLLCQIEAILNSRPLTPLSTDPSDFTPLTPGHFLIGRSINQHPEITHPSLIPISRLKKYKQLETIIDHFWKRWSKEYIHQLQVRGKWTKNQSQDSSQIQVGRLVLLKEPTNPLQWALGRITELHPGADGVTRVVSVKVRGGVVKRGVSMICVLPIEE